MTGRLKVLALSVLRAKSIFKGGLTQKNKRKCTKPWQSDNNDYDSALVNNTPLMGIQSHEKTFLMSSQNEQGQLVTIT